MDRRDQQLRRAWLLRRRRAGPGRRAGRGRASRSSSLGAPSPAQNAPCHPKHECPPRFCSAAVTSNGARRYGLAVSSRSRDGDSPQPKIMAEVLRAGNLRARLRASREGFTGVRLPLIATALELGLLDVLGERPVSTEHLAGRLGGIDQELRAAHLRVLVAAGVSWQLPLGPRPTPNPDGRLATEDDEASASAADRARLPLVSSAVAAAVGVDHCHCPRQGVSSRPLQGQ